MKDLSDAETYEPDYGNWVPLKLIYLPGALGLVTLLLSSFLAMLIIPALVLILIAVYFAYAHHLFSSRGKDIPRRVRQMVLDHLGGEGKGQALDIGCGNGALTIMLAKRFPDVRVTGIDYWGRNWDYSRTACERNAAIEGVGDRVTFQRASASSLPFHDSSFDIVISNFTFHEVRGVRDKGVLVREALRVLRPGGWFSFQDLFLLKSAYGDLDEMMANISDWGVEEVKFIDSRDSEFIPPSLRLPFMLGAIGIVAGKK